MFRRALDLISFLGDYRKYQKMSSGRFALKMKDLYPRLGDKTLDTPLDPIYFFQNAWCAEKIFMNIPNKHFDIGSDARQHRAVERGLAGEVVVERRLLDAHQPRDVLEMRALVALARKGRLCDLEDLFECVGAASLAHGNLGRY